ncbi:MAG: DNA repair exonuclease [Eubacteriales bacterium]|nr:DNA repair exonuclease [Bacillota bacterium]MBV1727702.1 DNA repair exonuclease [Desulforudis sp.]MDP3051255.1 DNA repair exonuclease [Eubacteriales bacterium]MDQ7789269.1 DNA repair exonuclease [Clostridia bacterium]MBU4532764.1 DNA repair exonuclease [Bacillota bacterium]
MVRILHLSDLHLGRPFGFLSSEKARFLREAQLRAFQRAVGWGQREGVTAILIVGDLFDSNDVSAKLLGEVQAIIRTSGIPFYILPGAASEANAGHDGLGPGSVYNRRSWNDLSNVCIFKDEECFYLDNGGVAVYARPSYPESPVLPRLPRHSEARHHIGLCHASVCFRDEIDDYPLTYEEIADCGFDYLALGHWHKRQDHSSGGVLAWYSGCPEVLDWDRDAQGGALLITLQDGSVEVETRTTGELTWQTTTVDISAKTAAEIAASVAAGVTDPEYTLLKVELFGTADPQRWQEAEQLIRERLDNVFHLQIDSSRVRPEIDPAKYPLGTVAGEYVRLLQDEIAALVGDDLQTEQQRTVLIDALHRGLAVLEGEMTLKDLDLEVVLP